jgi:hypothetical protein
MDVFIGIKGLPCVRHECCSQLDMPFLWWEFFMNQLINILATLVMSLALATGAHAVEVKSGAPLESSAQATMVGAKDLAGMDALIQSLQNGARVKLGLSTPSRGRSDDFAFNAPVSADSSAEIFDEATGGDGRMLVAGFILMLVIALRRIRR